MALTVQAVDAASLCSQRSSYYSVLSPEQLASVTGETDLEGHAHKAGSRTAGDGPGLSGESGTRVEPEQELGKPDDLAHQLESAPTKPFQRWIKTLHKRSLRRKEIPGYDGSLPPWLLETDDGDLPTRPCAHHRHSSSGSSYAFVTTVTSASMSLAGESLLAHTRRTAARSSRGQRTDRSSRASLSGTRHSEESCCAERLAPMDRAVMERSMQRRQILEELIETEEGYIGDVRFLVNVYITILASLPSSPAGLRSSVNRNLTEIVELHEEIIGELRRVVPQSECSQTAHLVTHRTRPDTLRRGHHRWRSLDAVPEGRDRISCFPDPSGLVTEPRVAAEVAKVFLQRMNRFFIYEEYGAKYELMIKDVAAAHRIMPGWRSYQKGLEVLASTLGCADSQRDQLRKSLTIGDLLVKPIQRVCKYPLLFSELLKHTPVIDCPHAHMEIENALIRLREATAEINRATNDSRTKSVLEKTWILQDRLMFPNQLDAASKNRIRSFGHIRLCGALHVCWQNKEGVDGQYMVALLYKEWLCLATADSVDQIYTIRACISLANISLEDVDNGRGLQCHTAPHSWKIVFLCDHQLYELILTACSPKEELEWCTRLKNSQQTADPGDHVHMQPDLFSFLSLNLKSLGTVFRKPGTMARRLSIHRATTVGPRSPLYQVILKNTSANKQNPPPGYGSRINRSQSLLTTNSRIPVLAPSRAERARLEALLSETWTRDVLPFPGITARPRSDHPVRASASSMMRKFSGSITSSFNRRSTSLASLQQKERAGSCLEGETISTSGDSRETTAPTPQPQPQLPQLPLAATFSPITLEYPAGERASPSTRPRRASESQDTSPTPHPVRRVRRRGTYPPCNTAVTSLRQPALHDCDDEDSNCVASSSACLALRKSSRHGSSRPPQTVVVAPLGQDGVHGSPLSPPSSLPAEGSVALTAAAGQAAAASPPPRRPSRSKKFSVKLARAGARHRGVVVEGIRSLFR